MARSYLVVLNDRAGAAHRVPEAEARIRAALGEDRGTRVTVVRPTTPEESQRALRLARRPGWTAVLAAGGDGTHHWLLHALAGSDVPLGLVPLGTANDLARACGVPAELEDACAIARRDLRARLDLVELTADGAPAGSFVTSGGLFLGADTALAVTRWRRRWSWFDRLSRLIGHRVYSLVLALLVLFAPRLWRRVRVSVDGGPARELEAGVAMAMNQEDVGRSFRAAPGASHRDGQVELFVILRRPGLLSRLHLAAALLATMRGRQVGRKDVLLLRGRRARIELASQEAFFADGEELARATTFELTLRPKALTVLVPSDRASIRMARVSPLLVSTVAA